MKIITESKTLLNILCLEDDLKDAELAKEMLVGNADYNISMDIATGEKKYVDFLKGSNYEFIADRDEFRCYGSTQSGSNATTEIPFICV